MAAEHERRLAEYEHQVGELQDQLKSLDEEIVLLRRRLQDAPKRVRTLEERILETKGQLAHLVFVLGEASVVFSRHDVILPMAAFDGGSRAPYPASTPWIGFFLMLAG